MRVSSLLTGSALALAGSSHGLNILMNNDDGFGSGNLRELYKMLKADGHNGESRLDLVVGKKSLGTDNFQSTLSHLRPSRAPKADGRLSPTSPSS